MAHDSKAIANYFLTTAEKHGQTLSPMKIQKLVYFANGWHLALKGSPLINEQVEAWKYGPVIPSLYRAFRRFGDQPITGLATRHVSEFYGLGDDAFRRMAPRVEDVPENLEFTKAFLDRVWETYGGYSAIQLSNETHKAGSPWDTVFRSYDGAIPKRTDIPADLMRNYFRALMRPEAKVQ